MTPQELKNSILQLAIQGKLVEQRPEEGTAAELLEKILATKNAKSAKKNLTRSRRDAHFAEKYNYILGNPVRKNLCAEPSEWPHSIAFSRETGFKTSSPR